MKKLIYMAAALAMAGMSLSSCDKEDDPVSSSNLDSIAKQTEAERAAELAKIDADTVLYYEGYLEYTTEESNNYDPGLFFKIDTTAIAKMFDITTDELKAGLESLGDTKIAGAPEIEAGDIEGSTHNFNSNAPTSATVWGNWYNIYGDQTEWGGDATSDITKAAFFVEYNVDKGGFTFGEYPGRLTIGNSYVAIQYLKYDDIVVAVYMKATVCEEIPVTGTVVKTMDANFDITVVSEGTDSVSFDFSQVESALGVTSMDDVKYIALDDASNYKKSPDASYNGYWMNADGIACGYSNGQYYLGSSATKNYLYFGQYAHKFTSLQIEGSDTTTVDFVGSFTTKYGFYYDSKIVMVNVKVTVKGFEDTEKAPTANLDKYGKMSYEVSKVWDDAYTPVSVDVKEQLEGAFGMTSYQIYQAFSKEEMKLYAGTKDTVYTANVPGYWLDTNGDPCAYANGVVFTELKVDNYADQIITLNIGNHPTNCANEAATKALALKVVYGDVTAEIDINLSITAKAAAAEGSSK